MSNGFLSQEEIDALLNGGIDKAAEDDGKAQAGSTSEDDTMAKEIEDLNAKEGAPETAPSEAKVFSENSLELPELSDLEKDLLGEVGNISMGSASTALSTIINQKVNITTPVVTVTNLNTLKKAFTVPNIALEVEFTSGILGENLLVMKISDAFVISNLMMGGDGVVPEATTELSEIELSAVSEAMNQMIGSAATSMATMFAREVNISPPISNVWSDKSKPITEVLSEEDPIVAVSFNMKIGEFVDSNIIQILTFPTAKKIVAIMMGQENEETEKATSIETSEPAQIKQEVKQEVKPVEPEPTFRQTQARAPEAQTQSDYGYAQRQEETPRVEVQKASFQPLKQEYSKNFSNNIDLILDVPLEISVVLGKTKKNIKDILNLGIGSLIELDKLAEEPVEILVNGKKIAYGEVVVVDENFGVRISNIISGAERVKTLSK